MRDYIIYTDSCADLDDNMIQQLGIGYLPMRFELDGNSYTNWPDGREVAFADFYNRLRGGASSTTSQVNITEFVDAFRPVLQSGKDVLYIGFSSGLSGTVNSARLAAQELSSEFGDAKLIVVDSLCASLGQGLLVWHAVQQQRQGKSIDETAAWLEDNKLHQAHWFTVNDLNFLKRGGRVSAASALIGTMLSIKPVLHVDDEGHLIAVEKVRGRKQSLDALLDQMEKTAIDAAGQTVFLSHGDAKEDADYVAKQLKSRFGVRDVYINYIGPVIGSHSGPETIALFFMAEHR